MMTIKVVGCGVGVSVGASVLVGDVVGIDVALALGVFVPVGNTAVDVADAIALSEGVADGWLVRVGFGKGFDDVGIGRSPKIKFIPDNPKIIIKNNGSKAKIQPVNRLGPKPKKRKVMMAVAIDNSKCNIPTNKALSQIWS